MKNRILFSILLLSIFLGSASNALASPQLGSATLVTPSTCTGSESPLVGVNSCLLVRVDCPGVPPAWAELRITEPLSGVTRGTAMFGTGGLGNEFYDSTPGGRDVAQDLIDQGFRLVQRRWTTSTGQPSGWILPGECILEQSCRYATLATWVHSNLHSGGAFVLSGNSGGAAEIGYALSSWGLEDIIDVAVLSAGPPLVRLDYGCLGASPWPSLCPGLIPAGVTNCGPSGSACLFSNTSGCNICMANPSPQHLRENSILHPSADTDYFNPASGQGTRVHCIMGSDDCDEGVVGQGVDYYNQISSERILEFVTQTSHDVFGSVRGQQAIVRAVLSGAASVNKVASLSPDSWPSLGSSFGLDLQGPPGGRGVVYFSLDTRRLENAELGWIYLPFPVRQIGASVALDASGRGQLAINVPSEPRFLGTEAFFQVLYSDASGLVGLSNLTSIVIRP